MNIVFVYGGYENLGLEYLSSLLKTAHHTTDLVFDYKLFNDHYLKVKSLSRIFDYRQQLLAKIVAFKPDVLAFSVVTDDYLWACDIAQAVKSKLNVFVVFGGIHPTSVPERVMRKNFVDFIVLGEGEQAFLDLVNNLARGETGANIKNVWSKKNGEIIKNALRPLSQQLDILPFPDKTLFYRELLFLIEEYRIITSRGCPFNCAYCANNFLRRIYTSHGQYFRRRSVDNVIEELILAKESWPLKRVQFYDDTFTFDFKWLERFSERYIQNIQLPFWCSVNPENVSHKIVKCLAQMGCTEVQMGVQILNPQIRTEILGRTGSVEEIRRAIIYFKKAGIKCVVDNILGLPEAQDIDSVNLLNFYNEVRPSRVSVYYLRYYPKTEMINIARNKGILDDDTIEALEEGQASQSFALGGSISLPRKTRQLDLFFAVFLLLPCSINRFIMAKKLYNFFPANKWFLLLIKIITRLGSVGTKNDINAERYFKRYKHFFKERIFAILH